MNRTYRAFAWLTSLIITTALMCSHAAAQPAITNPEVFCVTGPQPAAVLQPNDANGTDTSSFTFRASVAVTPPRQWFQTPRVMIDPFDPARPWLGGGIDFPMVQDGSQANGWKVVLLGSQLDGGSFGGAAIHSWAIYAADTAVPPAATDPTFSGGPNPAHSLTVFRPQDLEILPVDENWLPDKRTIPGQPGNGLRIDPADPTSPNDAGGAHIYTWRVRVRSAFPYGNIVGGLPPEFFLYREAYEWRDVRGTFDTLPFLLRRLNSGVILVLVAPDGTKHYCPMEIDPDNAANTGAGLTNQNTTYPLDPRFGGNALFRPVGQGNWQFGAGVFYRYRMMPTQYIFNHGGLPGEGPFTAFGGPTLPDSTPALPIGYGASADTEVIPGTEIWGRPFANEYAAFAGPDRTTPNPSIVAPPFPFYTDILNKSGQWKYYYVATTDLRPAPRVGQQDTYPFRNSPVIPHDFNFGVDPDAFLFNYDSDTGLAPGDPSLPYIHPMVTPILSDGGWTDDIPENGWGAPFGINGPAHRSRATVKTRVRFMVKATQPDNGRPPLLVRVFVNNAPHAMQPLPIANNSDYTQGVIYYYDQTFPVGTEGKHFMYFEADDGVHKAIWPRRPVDTQAPDLQAQIYTRTNPIPALSHLGSIGQGTDFGTGTVAFNYLEEPFINHRPSLSNPSVSPPSGVEGQAFTYEVYLFDPDGDEPVDAIVHIDDTDHRMQAVGTNTTNTNDPQTGIPGRRYRFTLNALAATQSGLHTYFFKFRDNWNNFADYRISPIRREFGEWGTLPTGDENGVPSSVFTGPTINSNKSAELFQPQIFPGDPAQTPATLWDFAIKYRDPENQAPTSIAVYLSNDDGATWGQGTALVKAESSSNYAAGVQFHLPARIRLPYSADNKNPPAYKYRLKFSANDGLNDTTVVHVGSGVNAINDGSAAVLVGIAPNPTTIFADPAGTRNWLGGPDLHVFKTNGSTKRELLGPGSLTPEYTYTLADLAAGRIVLLSPVTSGDVISASYYFVDMPGPVINPNRAPVLVEPIPPPPGDPNTNNGTLTPLFGQPSDNFTYSIIYKDADNQQPVTTDGTLNAVDLIVDNDTTRNPPLRLTPATAPPFDYVRGVKFTAVVLGSTLGIGTHTYHFETTDGSELARFPLANSPQPELNGPTVTDSSSLKLPPVPPFDTDRAIVPFPKGKHDDTYVFTVVYKSATGQAPPNDVEVRIKDNVTGIITAVKLNPIDPIGPTQYQTGVRYQVGLTAPAAPLTVGDHDVTFGFKGLPAATTPLTLTVNAQPTLAQDPGNPLVNPASQSRAGDLIFSVDYKDANGDLPAPVQGITKGLALQINKTDATPVITLDPTSPTTAPTAAQIKAGVLYQWTVQGPTLQPGTYNFYFFGADGTEATLPAQFPALPGGTFTVTAAQTIVLSEPGGSPADLNGTLTPLSGGTSTVYTYAVKYTHPDNVAPVFVRVIIDPGTANELTRDMTRRDANAFSAGTVYEYKTVPPELKPGVHTFIFRAADRINTVTKYATGTTPYTGPSVNNPPILTLGTAYIQGTTPVYPNAQNVIVPEVSGSILQKYIFEVSYSDVEGTAPTKNVVQLDDGSAPIVLHPAVANPSYANGNVVKFVSDPQTLTPGAKQFQFEFKDNFDSTFLPPGTGKISGLRVRNVPVLSAPTGGTLTPQSGPLSQTYTYQIIYTHADNTAPALNGGVRVFIDGTAHDMTKVGSGAFSAGVLYQFSFRFPTGTPQQTHTYRFEAVDSVDSTYIAKYPADGSNLNGPITNVPGFDTPIFTPNPGVVGQSMKIDSKLNIVPESAQPVNIKLTRPDGTGILAGVTTNADGTFSYTFTPNQSGDWKATFSWSGQQGVYDPISVDFPFKVAGFHLDLPAGVIDMIASPLIPATPDPSITFNVSDPNGVSLPITVLNLVKWLPTIPPAGRYVYLNTDANFPGIAGGQSYWVRPDQSAQINPRGKLVDQTHSYNIHLDVGWNMIGSVYLTDINWSAVKVSFNGQVLPLSQASSIMRSIAWTYNPATGGYELIDSTNVLKTGRGYWVKALQPCDIILPPPGTKAAELSRNAIDRGNSLQIAVRSGNRSDTNTFVPLTGSQASRMALMEKPPYVGDYVTAELLDPDKLQISTETRAALTGDSIVAFQVVTTKKNADVSVQFPNVSTLGRRVDITLVDLATGTRRAVGSNGGVTYNTGENAAPRRYALLISQTVHNGQLIISDVQASGRAAAGLSFSFNITAAANMRVQVVGPSGVVRDLSAGRAATRGVNALVWDGKNNRGASVAAGTYTLKLTASDDKGRQATAILPITLVR